MCDDPFLEPDMVVHSLNGSSWLAVAKDRNWTEFGPCFQRNQSGVGSDGVWVWGCFKPLNLPNREHQETAHCGVMTEIGVSRKRGLPEEGQDLSWQWTGVLRWL